MTNVSHHGACLCGGIVFDISGSPDRVFACYCDDCRQNAGGPFQIGAKFDAEMVKIREKESVAKIGTWIVKKTMSGFDKQKVFCRRCGCTLWTIPMQHGGRKLVVRIALLENGLEIFEPEAEYFVRCRPSYMNGMAGKKQIDTMPVSTANVEESDAGRHNLKSMIPFTEKGCPCKISPVIE